MKFLNAQFRRKKQLKHVLEMHSTDSNTDSMKASWKPLETKKYGIYKTDLKVWKEKFILVKQEKFWTEHSGIWKGELKNYVIE